MCKCASIVALLLVVDGLVITCEADDKPLVVAKRLANDRFNGWKYGEDASKKQIDCVQFVLAVVEETTRQKLPPASRERILISDVAAADLKRNHYALVVDEDPRTKGVQEALVTADLGAAIEPKNAKPGDLIQYWMQRDDGTWFGHAAVIETVTRNTRGSRSAELFGAHKSLNGLGTSTFNLDLTSHSKRKIYIVRLK
jgi:hypothetical protein